MLCCDTGAGADSLGNSLAEGKFTAGWVFRSAAEGSPSDLDRLELEEDPVDVVAFVEIISLGDAAEFRLLCFCKG
jgi:hypothetical protein